MKPGTRHIFLAVAGALLLCLASATAWLFGTNAGARWLLREIPRLTGVTLGTKTVEGTLWSGLRLEGLHVSASGVRAELQEFRIRWQPMPLLTGQVSIAELTGEKIGIIDARPETGKSPPAGLSWPRITGVLMHLDIRVRNFSADGIVYRRLDRPAVVIDRAAADLRFSHGTLTLRRTTLALPEFRIDGTAAAGFVRPSLRVDSIVRVAHPAAGMNRFSVKADLKPAQTRAIAAGKVAITGKSPAAPVFDLTSGIELASSRITLTRLRVARPGRNGKLTGNAELDLSADVPAFRMNVKVADLDLSKEVPPLMNVNGSAAIEGTLSRYRGRLKISNKRNARQSAALDAAFQGTARDLVISSLRGQLLGGSIRGSAAVSWKDVLSGSASIRIRDLNPALVRPEVAGTINIDLNGNMLLPKTGPPEGQINLRLLKSVLQGHPVTGDVTAAVRRNDLAVDRLALSGTGFGLKARGRLKQGIDFSAVLSDLSLFTSGVTGSLDARGTVRQSGGNFTGSLNARGRNLAAAGMNIRAVSLTGRLGDRAELPFSVNVDAHTVNYGTFRVDSLALSGSGTAASHTLRALARSSGFRIDARLAGGYRNGTWNGAIVQLSGSDPRGTWSMQKRTALSLSGDRFDLSPLIIRSTGGEQLDLAAGIGMHPLAGSFSVAWRGIDLGRANEWLAGAALSGRSAGGLTGKVLPDERLDVAGTMSVSRAVLTRHVQTTELRAEIRNAEAELAWREESLSLKLSLALAGYGSLEGKLAIPLPARMPVSMNGSGPLRGFVKGRVRESGAVSFLFPGLIQESRGDLAVDASVRGTWDKPDVKGSLLLDKAGGYFPAAGIHVTDIHVQAAIEQYTLRIDSLRATSGSGSIRGKAVVTMQPGKAVHYEGTIRGDKFQALFLPQMRVQIGPDLQFSGTTEKLTVRGKIQVPELLIYGPPRAAPVKPSEDVVIVGRSRVPEQRGLKTDIEVSIVLGKRIIVKAEGADAQLGGELLVSAASVDQVRARGEITVTKGKYSAYGVSLAISRGRLLFSGPVDNPSLDILAVKTVNEVKAGVLVTGTAEKPVVRLYSEPAMPDADILSYIALGHPLGGQDKQQASYLMQAAGALLSAGQSVALQDQLKQRLGLDTIDIETGSGNVGRSLITIGKYLAPQLYVSYGRALFTGGNLFRLRYKFGRHWELESHSGETSGLDLYYTIHFD